MKKIIVEVMYRPNIGKVPDKIAIIEIVEEDELFHLYIHYGNCSRKKLLRSLKQKTEYIELAVADFEKVVRKKLKEKYMLVPNGTHITCVGANAVLFPKEVKKEVSKKSPKETKPEHRKLSI